MFLYKTLLGEISLTLFFGFTVFEAAPNISHRCIRFFLLLGAEERAMHDTAPNSDQEDVDNQEEAIGECNSPLIVNANVEMEAEPIDNQVSGRGELCMLPEEMIACILDACLACYICALHCTMLRYVPTLHFAMLLQCVMYV